MEISFLGVGEACDPQYPNTSILVKTNNGSNNQYIMLDCGFTTPHVYFNSCSDSEQLDALWISHFHGDHFFGIPLLLLRFWEMGRMKPLLILGQHDVEEKVWQTMDMAYSGFKSKLNFQIDFIVLEPGHTVEAASAVWQASENDHSQRCLAVRFEANGKSIFYSGDGRPTHASCDLAQGSDLVIHEAFQVEHKTSGHGSVQGCLDFAKDAKVKNLALVHLQREVRSLHQKEIRAILDGINDFNAFLPEPGQTFVV